MLVELNLKKLRLNFQKNKNLYNNRGFGFSKIKKINTLFGVPSCNIFKNDFINDIFSQKKEISQKDLRDLNIGAYINSGCRRGVKHTKNLPVSGQRNRTNAKTRKKFNIY